MARIRSIKPEFFTSLTVADLSLTARMTFIGLWTHVDDDGRCVDDARLVRAAVWPLDDRVAADVEEDLRVLQEARLVVRYEVEGRRYLTVRNWREHQRIDKPKPSRLPGPGSEDTSPTCGNTGFPDTSATPPGRFPDPSPIDPGSVPVGKEQGTGSREQETSATPPPIPPPAAAEAAPPPDPQGAPPQERADVVRVCEALADAVAANGSNRPIVTERWRTEARLMLDKDGRTVEQVLGAVAWCQSDPFWRANVMSMAALRKQYDRLRLQARQRPGSPTSTVDQRVTTALRLADRLAAEEAEEAAAGYAVRPTVEGSARP
ncbi:hypothetical protein ACFQLX_14185 [Streptomyces polyrhachis]|uniref:Uncharacterized protein n=1 Tax=Streptomyces polyrhachis TaxID=1282885 RepID=A0ABW2GF22_9ACTN